MVAVEEILRPFHSKKFKKAHDVIDSVGYLLGYRCSARRIFFGVQ